MKNMICKAVALGALLPMAALADVPVLPVTVSENEVSVSVEAGVLDSTSELYLVWDETDHGNNLLDWPSEKRLQYEGDVSSSAATYDFNKSSVPVGDVMRVIATSDIGLIGGYVALTNTQYVNTGIVAYDNVHGFDVNFRPYGTYSATVSSGAKYPVLIGSIQDKFILAVRNGNFRQWYLVYQGAEVKSSADTQINIPVPNTTSAHSIRVFDQTVYLNGSVVTAFNDRLGEGAVDNNSNSDRPILLGASWDDKNTANLKGRYCDAEWHHVTLYGENGTVLAEIVPAIRGTGTVTPGFYDVVNERFLEIQDGGNRGAAYVYDEDAAASPTSYVAKASSQLMSNARTAYWTGAGDHSNLNDPANWRVEDETGSVVVGGIPDDSTVVRIEGSIDFSCPAGQHLAYARLSVGDCTLAADCDWSGLVKCAEYVDVSQGAYIDTQFTPNSNTRVVMDVTVNGNPEYWFGVRSGWNKSGFAAGNASSKTYIAFGDTSDSSKALVSNGRHTIDFNKSVFYVDGSQIKEFESTAFSAEYHLCLFGINQAGSMSFGDGQVVRFYSCQVYDNGTLIRDYVPAMNGTEFCLYEKVSGAFVTFSKMTGTGAVSGSTTTVAINGTIDLAGYSLTLADVDGEGTITDSVGNGELHLDVIGGNEVVNTGLSFTGSLKLVKEGMGTFTAGKSGQSYTGGTIIAEGWAKNGVLTTQWGPRLSVLTVEDGAGFDWAIVPNASSTPYSFDIAGCGPDSNGAVVFPSGNSAWNATFMADLALSADALVRDPSTSSRCGLNLVDGSVTGHSHQLALNNHTLTVAAGGYFRLVNVEATTAGTIAVTANGGGNGNKILSISGASAGTVTNNLSLITVEIGDGCSLESGGSTGCNIVGTLIDCRTAAGHGDSSTIPLVVAGAYQPMTTNLWTNIILGDATHLAPVLDLSGISEPFMLPSGISLAVEDGATAYVRLGSRKTSSGRPIISWEGEMPPYAESITFERGDESRSYGISRQSDGWYAAAGFVIFFK